MARPSGLERKVNNIMLMMMLLTFGNEEKRLFVFLVFS